MCVYRYECKHIPIVSQCLLATYLSLSFPYIIIHNIFLFFSLSFFSLSPTPTFLFSLSPSFKLCSISVPH